MFQVIGVALYLILFLLPSVYYLSEKTWWMPKSNFFLLREFFFTLMFGTHRYGLSEYNISIEGLVVPKILSLIFFGTSFTAAINFSKKADNTKSELEQRSYVTLSWWLFLPLAIAYVVSYLKPLFAIKHLIYLLPPFLILSANGYNIIQSRVSKIFLLAAAIMTSAFSLPLLYRGDNKVQWRGPARYIYHNLKFGESVVICSSKETIPFMYYFDYGNKDRLKAWDIYGQWSKGTWEKVIKYNDAVIVMIDEKRRVTRNSNPFEDFQNKFAGNKFSWRDTNIWVAASVWGREGNFPLIENKLSKTHIKVLEKRFSGVSVAYWKKMTLAPE
jgi:hypothetical protein